MIKDMVHIRETLELVKQGHKSNGQAGRIASGSNELRGRKFRTYIIIGWCIVVAVVAGIIGLISLFI